MRHDSAVFLFLVTMMVLALASGCATKPLTVERTMTTAFTQTEDTWLGRKLAPAIADHPGESGFLLLSKGSDALMKRLVLVNAAEQAIDLQYYIWNSDHSGRLLAAHVLAAADRGVRVRLLLDDFNLGGRDDVLAGLDSHPKIQIQVYNPFWQRRGLAKWLGALAELGRINRRMHNKALIVDGSVAIVGGRNIGDEYFDLHPKQNFLDRDLLAVGPMVDEISASFDRFWNSDVAFPISTLIADTPVTVPNQASGHCSLWRNISETVAAQGLPMWCRSVESRPHCGRFSLRLTLMPELAYCRQIQLDRSVFDGWWIMSWV